METFWCHNVTCKSGCFSVLGRGDFSRNSDILQLVGRVLFVRFWLAGGTGPRYFGNEGRIYQSVPQAPPRTLQRFVRRFLMAFNLPRQYNWSHVASSRKCCNDKADEVFRVDNVKESIISC